MASDPKKTVAKTWTFESDSNPNKTYETLQFADSSTSCNCMGWTRKTDFNGNRSCKHTRLVHQNLADKEAIGMIDYTKDNPQLKQTLETAIKVRDTMVSGKRALAI